MIISQPVSQVAKVICFRGLLVGLHPRHSPQMSSVALVHRLEFGDIITKPLSKAKVVASMPQGYAPGDTVCLSEQIA